MGKAIFKQCAARSSYAVLTSNPSQVHAAHLIKERQPRLERRPEAALLLGGRRHAPRRPQERLRGLAAAQQHPRARELRALGVDEDQQLPHKRAGHRAYAV